MIENSMTKTVNNPNLAVIGMAVSGNHFDNLDDFGFKVFHGNDHIHSKKQNSITDYDSQNLITKLLQSVGLTLENIGIITLDTQVEVKNNRSGKNQSKFHLSVENGSLLKAWLSAAECLYDSSVNAILLIEENQAAQTLFAILLSTEAYANKAGKEIFSRISCVRPPENADKKNSLLELTQSALSLGNVKPQDIGLLITSSSLKNELEKPSTQGLISPLRTKQDCTCAISVGQGGLGSIIKTVWCLHHRVIPGTKDWTAPANPHTWQDSPFYIPTKSRTWFTSACCTTRNALLIARSDQDIECLFILSEENRKRKPTYTAFNQVPLFLFPIGGTTSNELLDNLLAFQQEIDSHSDLRSLSTEIIKPFHKGRSPNNFITCILGDSRENISREIKFALKGIPTAFTRKSEWRTPKGSYFTPVPLADDGTVAFVYPGAFNTYPGVAQDIFYLFPHLLNRLEKISKNISTLMSDKLLYPRQISALSSRDVINTEKRLINDPLAMLISGTSLSTLYTLLLREIFEVQPTSVFGYSLGEISMMFANRIWTQVDQASAAIHASPLFHTRLAGPQNAIREKWNLPKTDSKINNKVIWENYVLMASAADVKKIIKNEDRVFMTHINTPNQVVIGGDPEKCRDLITALKCNSIQAPFNYVLHCEAMQSEFNALKRLLSWPVVNLSEIKFYTAANHQSLPNTQETIAEEIARGLCHQLDFPRLIDKAYTEGVRIFIELGAGANCTRWIKETLQDKPHAALTANRKGLNDHAAILQMLAKLICHRVPVNLMPFLI